MRDWLIEIREKSKMSRIELAETVGIGYHSIVKYENGIRNPSVDIAKKIGKTLGFDWIKFYDNKQTLKQ